MSTTAVARSESAQAWPLTKEALERLVDEIAQLRQDLSSLTGQGLEEGIVRLPVTLAARRLETLHRVLERAEVVSDSACATIGRQALLRDESGEHMTYWIVFPGDGDPAQGWISADSPLGTAILGAKAGDVVEVDAPNGTWFATVVSVA